MIYITEDTHRDFKRFVLLYNISKDNILIILGDAEINYYGKLYNKLFEDIKELNKQD